MNNSNILEQAAPGREMVDKLNKRHTTALGEQDFGVWTREEVSEVDGLGGSSVLGASSKGKWKRVTTSKTTGTADKTTETSTERSRTNKKISQSGTSPGSGSTKILL